MPDILHTNAGSGYGQYTNTSRELNGEGVGGGGENNMIKSNLFSLHNILN